MMEVKDKEDGGQQQQGWMSSMWKKVNEDES